MKETSTSESTRPIPIFSAQSSTESFSFTQYQSTPKHNDKIHLTLQETPITQNLKKRSYYAYEATNDTNKKPKTGPGRPRGKPTEDETKHKNTRKFLLKYLYTVDVSIY